MDELEIYETLKQYTLYVEGLDFKIHARISKRVNCIGHMDYKWEVSHYYVPFEEAASVNIPNGVLSNDERNAELLLINYLKNFTDIGVIPNKFY